MASRWKVGSGQGCLSSRFLAVGVVWAAVSFGLKTPAGCTPFPGRFQHRSPCRAGGPRPPREGQRSARSGDDRDVGLGLGGQAVGKGTGRVGRHPKVLASDSGLKGAPGWSRVCGEAELVAQAPCRVE